MSLFPHDQFLGSTQPVGGIWKAFLAEVILSFALMSVIFYAIVSKKSTIISAFLIGLVVFIDAYFGGPVSGASMNPARSIGPALVSGQTDYL